MTTQEQTWKNCSSCKKPIGFKQKYFECSVSTCQGQRTGYVFCSIFCWERHLPGARHRDAGAIEKISPSAMEWKAQESQAAGKEILIRPNATAEAGLTSKKPALHDEVLVVVSKMKNYIKEIADMNTSNEVADVLSAMIRKACDDAINSARADGRKTVMGRDFK